jgi:hypothetical protein
MLRESRCLPVAFLVLALLAATAGSAPGRAADLSWLSALSAPNLSQADSTPIFMAAKPRITPKATCTASCGSYSVTCSYTSPTTCTAVDRNCSVFQTGYVQCGSDPRVYCTPDCPVCTDGQLMFQPTGSCCDGGLTEKDKYQCINGQWEYVTTVCKLPICGPV